MAALQEKLLGEVPRLAALVQTNGSLPVTTPLTEFLERCLSGGELRRQIKELLPALLADIAHFMAISHGRHPGVVDHAADRMADDAARDWLVAATNGFAAERALLNRMIVAAGPIQRHADQDKVSALLAVQARSFELLATSDRVGCAAGAALAFVLDWGKTRPLLDLTARILSVEVKPCSLPDEAACTVLADELASSPPIARALQFGAEQILAQQSGLWRLVAARHTAFSAIN